MVPVVAFAEPVEDAPVDAAVQAVVDVVAVPVDLAAADQPTYSEVVSFAMLVGQLF